MSAAQIELRFEPGPGKAPLSVSAVMDRPGNAAALLVLGHGAGTHMRHPYMQTLSGALNRAGVATLRYNYPYSERGAGMDPERVRLAAVRAAIATAARRAPRLPLFAGGHSMSGRMTSLAVAAEPVEALRGIVFYAFPLHAGKPEADRAGHLQKLSLPLLFLSGERDRMADWALLQNVADRLGGRATLHRVDSADHGFKVLRRRQNPEPVMDELARVTRVWIDGMVR